MNQGSQNLSAIQQVITDRKLPLLVCDAKTLEDAQVIAEEFYEENNPYSFDLQENAQIRFMCIEKLIFNYQHVAKDVVEYNPTRYDGKIIYFKPEVIPEGSVGAAFRYQKVIHEKKAGGYEAVTTPENLYVVMTPHEHDLMMDDESLDIIVPKLIEMCEQNRKVFQFPATLESVENLKAYIMKLSEITQKNRLVLCLLAEEIMVNIVSY